ncbi:dATP/dGTP diphosphohydrolase domain-containing protein [Catenuloplanes sp. NPDC051500]|uniref:dATP/dGTP diphosphohydrolase domain-containing protein n=1 Tax=Catenuloplanes sp. NPDC051500 TaxID=3363959 RepID=UPI00379C6DE1
MTNPDIKLIVGGFAVVTGDTQRLAHALRPGTIVALVDVTEYGDMTGWECRPIGQRDPAVKVVAKVDLIPADLPELPPLTIELPPGATVTPETRERPVSATGGAKEQGAARYDLVPEYPLRLLAERFGYGPKKYPTTDGLDNWRRGYAWSLSFAAMMRHAWAFWRGEDEDAETGQPHLAAVAWHAFALLEWSRHPDLVERYDDRQDPKTGAAQ